MEIGGFTIPGEAGYEHLTLELARRWGADMVRDSDGTQLSPELTSTGMGVYSTVCVIRDHNAFLREHPHTRQQCILCAGPVLCTGDPVDIRLMDGYFDGQFAVNSSEESVALWQVFDRTTGEELDRKHWRFDPASGVVRIHGTAWHSYTVNFFAWRVWEEISMYNHVTNSWDRERLLQLDPMHPEARAYLSQWMETWCREHPATHVVRFTSLFYNFAWIWGSDERNRHLFTDWASYDFPASPLAFALFENEFGYKLTTEDFICNGRRRPTHHTPDHIKRDWMTFVGSRVLDMGRELTDIVHSHGKKAYVFLDDSWIGLEPYGGRFTKFGFDGLIKCVFSGFEARLCAGIDVDTHELRLHPYLFPVGLGGSPTFSQGGDPAHDARVYWARVRRALLREPVERIGLGGYLHLTENFPDFVDRITDIIGQFQAIKALHAAGKPSVLPLRVAVLHAWGGLRTWTLSGHFHETCEHDLIHILESLSGLPLGVGFLSFDELESGGAEGYDVILCAGRAGTAWSGDGLWSVKAVERLTAWTHHGGVLIGVGEPSASAGGFYRLAMAHVLGVDVDETGRVCHGKWQFACEPPEGLIPSGAYCTARPGAFLTDGRASVWMEDGGLPSLTYNRFGAGAGVYMASIEYCPENTRLLLNLLMSVRGATLSCIADDARVECSYYPAANAMAVVNNADAPVTTTVSVEGRRIELTLEPLGMEIVQV